jgi:hypothetical protein
MFFIVDRAATFPNAEPTNPIWPDATNLTRRKREVLSANVVANDAIDRIGHQRKQKPHEVSGSTFRLISNFDTYSATSMWSPSRGLLIKASSGEVEAGSRQENASNRESRAPVSILSKRKRLWGSRLSGNRDAA